MKAVSSWLVRVGDFDVMLGTVPKEHHLSVCRTGVCWRGKVRAGGAREGWMELKFHLQLLTK